VHGCATALCRPSRTTRTRSTLRLGGLATRRAMRPSHRLWHSQRRAEQVSQQCCTRITWRGGSQIQLGLRSSGHPLPQGTKLVSAATFKVLKWGGGVHLSTMREWCPLLCQGYAATTLNVNLSIERVRKLLLDEVLLAEWNAYLRSTPQMAWRGQMAWGGRRTRR
jgi:hypothetical protein